MTKSNGVSVAALTNVDWMNVTLVALQALGGDGTITQIEHQVIGDLGLTPRAAAAGRRYRKYTTLQYRLMWARSRLKKLDLAVNTARGHWELTATGQRTKHVRDRDLRSIRWAATAETRNMTNEESAVGDRWRVELLDALKALHPSDFEHACREVLAASGFTEVEVTGKSGDGGIDGHGILQIGGMVSFPVVFQCKRYDGNVTAPALREFRGAMAGRASKGLVITTGGFTTGAMKAATTPGVDPIDLIDGDALVTKMHHLGLGIVSRSKEVIDVNHDWFAGLGTASQS